MFLKNKNIIFKIRRSKVTDYAALISLCDMAAFITVHLQIFKRPQLLRFSTDLDETGIKGVAVPFKSLRCCIYHANKC